MGNCRDIFIKIMLLTVVVASFVTHRCPGRTASILMESGPYRKVLWSLNEIDTAIACTNKLFLYKQHEWTLV